MSKQAEKMCTKVKRRKATKKTTHTHTHPHIHITQTSKVTNAIYVDLNGDADDEDAFAVHRSNHFEVSI